MDAGSNPAPCALSRLPLSFGFTIPNGDVTDDCLLEKVQSVCDFGIIIDEKLNFSQHCITVTAKCGKTANCILRSFQNSNHQFLINMFKVFIRPIAEYGSAVHNPQTAKDDKLIESIQRCFTSRIAKNSHLSHEERCNLFNLETLRDRRLSKDMTLAYKIIFNNYGMPPEQLFDFILQISVIRVPMV